MESFLWGHPSGLPPFPTPAAALTDLPACAGLGHGSAFHYALRKSFHDQQNHLLSSNIRACAE